MKDKNNWTWAGSPTAMPACVPQSLKSLSFHSQSGSYLGLIFFPPSCVAQTLSLPWQDFHLPKCLSLAMNPRDGVGGRRSWEDSDLQPSVTRSVCEMSENDVEITRA